MIIQNEWSGLFAALEEKVNSNGRRILLSRLIGRILDVTQQNFGEEGINRPEEWADLTLEYALETHDGDQTPTLILPDGEHEKRHPEEPHMIDNFRVDLHDDSATLTNLAEYASQHQNGRGSMYRPFFPIKRDGTLSPPMVIQLEAVLNFYFDLE